MAVESNASIRLANAFLAGRKTQALMMAQGFARELGGLRATQIEIGANYLEDELRNRDDAMVRLLLGIDTTSLLKGETQSSVIVSRAAVKHDDIIWDNRVPFIHRENPDYAVTLGVRWPTAKSFNLSRRLIEVIASIVAGNETYKQIAAEFTVGVPTVKTQLEHIFQRLEVAGKTSAAVKSIREGIIFWVED